MKIITIIISLLGAVSILNAQTNWQQKIDAEVWAEVAGQNEFEFLVLLRDQANTAAAKNLKTKEEKGKYVYELLQKKAAETQGDLLQLLQQKKVAFKPYFVVNAIWVKGNSRLLELLARRQEIAKIMPNPRIKNNLPKGDKSPNNALQKSIQSIEWGISKIKADKLWAYNIKGKGVVIGGQDTGYEWEHPALKNQYRGQSDNHNYHWHDAIHFPISGSLSNSCGYDSKVPCDDHYHGTHTMGTMVGDDGQGRQIGVAPAAKWIACRNMENGWGSPATYIECFEWFLAPTDTNNNHADPSQSPHVIANSWGCPPSEGCNTSNFNIMRVVVANLKNAGIFVVVSAGNDGPSCHSINSPAAIFEESFSIGATDENDVLAGFSSRGSVTVDGSLILKPNVVAPGVSVYSSVTNGDYQNLSGTSMAGPHVAGAVALLIAAQPRLAGQVDSLENILEMTADFVSTTDSCGGVLPSQIPNNLVGYGRINLERALQMIRPDLYIAAGRLEDNKLYVFPNPVSQKVLLRTKQNLGACTVLISNSIGQIVRNFETEFNSALTLDVSELGQGMYVIRVDNGQETLVTKIIKK